MVEEGVGGCCPRCQQSKILYRTGGEGYFTYEACPECGYGYGHCIEPRTEGNWVTRELRDEELWAELERIFGMPRRVYKAHLRAHGQDWTPDPNFQDVPF